MEQEVVMIQEENISDELTPEMFELPPFSFVGTDGEIYQIGPTPRNFERDLFIVIDRIGTLGSDDNMAMKEFIDLWDDWIYEHLKVVPEQQHLTREHVESLYFVVDRPIIIQHIMDRFSEAVTASTLTMAVITEASAHWTEQLKALRGQQEGVKDADNEPSGQGPVLEQDSDS